MKFPGMDAMHQREMEANLQLIRTTNIPVLRAQVEEDKRTIARKDAIIAQFSQSQKDVEGAINQLIMANNQLAVLTNQLLLSNASLVEHISNISIALGENVHEVDTDHKHTTSGVRSALTSYVKTYPDIAEAVRKNEGSKAELAKRFHVSETTIARVRRELANKEG